MVIGILITAYLSLLTSHNSEMPTFRLIDVQNMNVVVYNKVDIATIRYASLSYVWGGPQKTRLVKSNLASLQKPQALDWSVSTTVKDAIGFAKKLNVQYLWVDALCILQDDDDDKAVQIGKMGDIYAQALVTIVAASGESADAGLPGFDMEREGKQTEFSVCGTGAGSSITLMRVLISRGNNHIEDTPWAKRGWTLQERALSNRSITFTDQQLIWSCKKSQWLEETYCETSLAHASWTFLRGSQSYLNSSARMITAGDDLTEQVWYKFRLMVLDFTARKLTESGDAHDAFSAILQQVQGLIGEKFLWAMPSTRFELALCWEPEASGVVRRSCLTTLPQTSLHRRVPFPSWSWLGWQGSINLRVEDRYQELG